MSKLRVLGFAVSLDGRDIHLGGGAATVREYLQAGLIDGLHLALRPLLMGRGERCSPDSTSTRSATNAPARNRATRGAHAHALA